MENVKGSQLHSVPSNNDTPTVAVDKLMRVHHNEYDNSVVGDFKNRPVDAIDWLVSQYSEKYRLITENISSIDRSSAMEDNVIMLSDLSDIIRRRREEKGLSTQDVETVARSFMDIIDQLPEEAGEASRLLIRMTLALPDGETAISRTISLIEAKRDAVREVFDRPRTARLGQKVRSVELDVQVTDLDLVRSAMRLVNEYRYHPYRFTEADIERVRAARRLVKAADRRRRVPRPPTS